MTREQRRQYLLDPDALLKDFVAVVKAYRRAPPVSYKGKIKVLGDIVGPLGDVLNADRGIV